MNDFPDQQAERRQERAPLEWILSEREFDELCQKIIPAADAIAEPKRAQPLAEVLALLSDGIDQELNTVLNTVADYVSCHPDDFSPTDPIGEALTTINDASRRAANLAHYARSLMTYCLIRFSHRTVPADSEEKEE